MVWFPGPQVDFLEDSEEGVAEVVEPEEAASNADRQMDLKKVGFSKGQCFAFSKWLNLRKVFHFGFNLSTNVPNHSEQVLALFSQREKLSESKPPLTALI